jgi:hypothetical protein
MSSFNTVATSLHAAMEQLKCVKCDRGVPFLILGSFDLNSHMALMATILISKGQSGLPGRLENNESSLSPSF